MTANPRTIATLEDLESAEWFANCGVQDTPSAVVLESWNEAMKHCADVEWENLKLEAANQYWFRLRERSMERSNLWNKVVDVVKPLSTALVEKKARPFAEKHSLPKVFLDNVEWDILHLCMEAEYADVFGASFYASLSYWYSKGHYPCGWEGPFPQGKIVIY